MRRRSPVLFLKIKVRPRSFRSYLRRRPCFYGLSEFHPKRCDFFSGPVLDSIVYDAAPHTCAPHQCSHDATIIEAYNVGKMYEYDYLVDSNTEMRSASPSKQSNLNMVARVKVQVLTPCEFSVKVIHLNPFSDL